MDYNPTLSFLRLLSGTTRCSRFILHFPCLALDLTISSRIHSSFFWRIIFREDLGTHVLTETRVSLLCLSQDKARTHTFTHLYLFLYFCICTILKNMGSYGYLQLQRKQGSIPSILFICNCLLNGMKSHFHYLEYIQLFVQSQYKRKSVSESLIPL